MGYVIEGLFVLCVFVLASVSVGLVLGMMASVPFALLGAPAVIVYGTQVAVAGFVGIHAARTARAF